MKWFYGLLCLLFSSYILADSIEHYMSIANEIPKLEVKANAKAQLWAQSARKVLGVANESILETLMQMNKLQQKINHKPLFCLPANTELSMEKLGDMIKKTYFQQKNKKINLNGVSVSEIALQAVMKEYPCSNRFSRMSGIFNKS